GREQLLDRFPDSLEADFNIDRRLRADLAVSIKASSFDPAPPSGIRSMPMGAASFTSSGEGGLGAWDLSPATHDSTRVLALTPVFQGSRNEFGVEPTRYSSIGFGTRLDAKSVLRAVRPEAIREAQATFAANLPEGHRAVGL